MSPGVEKSVWWHKNLQWRVEVSGAANNQAPTASKQPTNNQTMHMQPSSATTVRKTTLQVHPAAAQPKQRAVLHGDTQEKPTSHNQHMKNHESKSKAPDAQGNAQTCSGGREQQ
jgi:hypothetical protein